MVSTADIAQILEGMDFPAQKEDCIDWAERSGAPRELLDIINELPEGTYYSMAAVRSAVDEIK